MGLPRRGAIVELGARFRPVVIEGSLQVPQVLRLLPLQEIKPRVHDTLRPLNEFHVEELVDSIGELGLINPIATDRALRLIAGAHRLEAIRRLIPLRRWEGPIPVRVFPDVDAQANPDLARLIEVAENDKRRDYTAAEVRALADWLTERGFVKGTGRPAKGFKPLVPALSVIVGKSQRRLQQILAGRPERRGRDLKGTLAILSRAINGATRALDADPRPAAQELRDELRAVLASISALAGASPRSHLGSPPQGSRGSGRVR